MGVTLTNKIINEDKKSIKKVSKKRRNKVSLQEWESENGVLSFSMIENWAREKQYHPKKVQNSLENFKIKVAAGGNEYANFVAAFQNWINSGYLDVTPEQLRLVDADKDLHMKTDNFGVRL